MPEEDDPRSDRATPVSGLVVPIDVPPALAALRRRWDRAAQAGAGAHVTILYPFVPCSELGPPVREELAAIARRVEAFDVRFEHLRRFPGVVWIEPEPGDTFLNLTAAVVERWPQYPPYGGMFEALVPHLTVLESGTAPLDVVEDAVRQIAPFSGRASRLELWCQDAAGRWRPRWRMPFRVRP